MADLILHHYWMSPFAEKIRMIMGYKKLDWVGVQIPNRMPKPDLTALTGGYRRTPVLQIGADIYCDTALICDVLEHVAPNPSLYPQHQKGETRILAHWADGPFFPVAMAHSFKPEGAAQVFANVPPEEVKVFVQDRATMRGGSPRMPPADATGMIKSHLRRLADMLHGRQFLLGDQPSLADFSVAHPLWFKLKVAPATQDVFDATPEILPWLQRIIGFGHGQMTEISSSQAIEVARNHQPLALGAEPFIDEHGIALGSEVTITAESFGLEPTNGTLVAATRTKYVLRREDSRAGLVHVHFPRMGFILNKVQA
jgi:glutathione S-transferase